MSEKSLNQSKFANLYLEPDRALLMKLKSQQNKILEQIRTENSKVIPDENLIKNWRAEKLNKAKIILEIRSKKPQKEQADIAAKINKIDRLLNPEKYANYELSAQDFQKTLRNCLAEAVIEIQNLPNKLLPKEELSIKSSVSRCFNGLIREVGNDLSLSRYGISRYWRDSTYYKNPTQVHLYEIIKKLYEISNRSTQELVEIKHIGTVSADYVKRGLELFLQIINYQPEEK